jgi:hypothetical protein
LSGQRNGKITDLQNLRKIGNSKNNKKTKLKKNNNALSAYFVLMQNKQIVVNSRPRR